MDQSRSEPLKSSPEFPHGDAIGEVREDLLADGTLDHIVCLDITGELSDKAGVLDSRIRTLMQQGERAIVINLAGVTSWDSWGLGEIVRAVTTVYRQGASLAVRNAPRGLDEFVEMMKLV